ncbi:MAG: hypothetical protein J1F11_09970 [Oscillospiraceae bacterium]|nr:hypothetical protein [Oscillospiraceae bacterium]
MADFITASPFGYHSTITSYFEDVRLMDAAFRYAESGDDPREFERIAGKAFDPSINISNENIMCLLMILLKNRKTEFAEILRHIITEREKAYQPMRGFADYVDTAMLIRAMDLISDDFVEEQYLPRTNPFMPMGTMTGNFLNTPMYRAIITKNTDHMNRYLDRAVRNDEELTEYMLSAICFRDTDFLEAAFRKGAVLENEMISAICTDFETVAYLCDNFSEYIFKDMTENDDPRNNMRDFIRLTVCDEAMFRFAEGLYDRLGPDRFAAVSDMIPKVHIIKAHYAETNIFRQSTGSDQDFLRSVLSDNIVVVIEDDHTDFVFTLEDILRSAGINASIFYDLSRCKTNFFAWQHLNTVRRFLKKSNITFDTSGFSGVLSSLLDYNDETIVKELISRLAINESNIEEVIEYLTENSLYRALNAVSKFYTPVII